MAATFVAASGPQQFSAQTSVTFAFAAGSGANKVVVDIGWYNTLVTISSVTYNGVAMTAVSGGGDVSPTYSLKVKSYYLDDPPTGSVNVVVTFSTDVNVFGTVGATSYSSAAAGAPGAITEATGASDTAPTVTQASSTAGSIVHGCAAVSFQATTLTPNDSENWTAAPGVTWKGASQRIAGGGSKTLDWTASSNSAWIAQCFEISAGASQSNAPRVYSLFRRRRNH